jgi:hypothetical protein
MEYQLAIPNLPGTMRSQDSWIHVRFQDATVHVHVRVTVLLHISYILLIAVVESIRLQERAQER